MKKEMTFEAAGTELDAILAELSDSETPLDRSLVLYALSLIHIWIGRCDGPKGIL